MYVLNYFNHLQELIMYVKIVFHQVRLIFVYNHNQDAKTMLVRVLVVEKHNILYVIVIICSKMILKFWITPTLLQDFCLAREKLLEFERGINATADFTMSTAINTFWDTFDAVFGEEQNKTDSTVMLDLDFLQFRRSRKMGLTETMLEEKIVPLLNRLDGFGSYSKMTLQIISMEELFHNDKHESN